MVYGDSRVVFECQSLIYGRRQPRAGEAEMMPEMTIGRRQGLLSLALVALMLSSGVAMAQDAPVDGAPDTAPGEDIDYTREQIVVVRDDEEGIVKLKLGESEMHVDYGDGRISFLANQTRYLGIADVYHQRQGFDKRVGIPAQTIVYQRLVGIIEYTDENNNGLFDVRSGKVAGTIEELNSTLVTHEETQKWIDFNDIQWTLSSWSEQGSGNNRQFEFVLSATDVPYSSTNGSDTSDTVSRIAYIFRVTTHEEQVSIHAVPHYRVMSTNTSDSNIHITNSELVAYTNVTGTVLNSTWKYDQAIEGWDVATDSSGNERNDTRLLVLTEMAFGVHLHKDVGAWMMKQFGDMARPRAIVGAPPVPHLPTENQPHPDAADLELAAQSGPNHDPQGNPLRCGMEYVSDGGDDGTSDTGARSSTTETVEEQKLKQRIREYTQTACRKRGDVVVDTAESDDSQPEVIRSGSLHFEDNGARLGRIRWVSNATVDGLETEVLFQMHGARPVLPEDIHDGSDDLWAGVRAVGGYNYVIGDSVFHDPEFGADVLTIQTSSFGEPEVWNVPGPLFQMLQMLLNSLPVILGMALIAAVLVGVASIRSRRELAPLPPSAQYAPAGAWTTPGEDWEQYRD